MSNDNIILTELREIKRDIKETQLDVKGIKTILLGNGSKGHEQRIEDIEGWKKGMPDKCPAEPLSKSDVIKRRLLEVSIMGLIIGILEFVIPYFVGGV